VAPLTPGIDQVGPVSRHWKPMASAGGRTENDRRPPTPADRLGSGDQHGAASLIDGKGALCQRAPCRSCRPVFKPTL